MKYFISYTQKDRAWAEWIAWHIEANTSADGGPNQAIIQAWDFDLGRNFVDAMNEAVMFSDVTVPILSPAFQESEFTKAEWTTAFAKDPLGRQGTLLPIRVDTFDVEGLLGPIVYLDLVGLGKDEARERLVAGLRRERRKPSQEPDFPMDSFSVGRTLGIEPAFPGPDQV